MMIYAIEFAGCLLAVAAAAFATVTAGRLAGISLTAFASGLMAFLLPPVFSLRVANPGDIATLLAYGVAGLVVTQTVRPRRARNRRPEPAQVASTRTTVAGGRSLSEAISRATHGDATLDSRTSDLYSYVDHNACFPIADQALDQILLDSLRIAFAHSNVQRVSLYSSRRPEEECIRIVAEYEMEPALPHVRITGRSDSSCAALKLPAWPDGCSATWFDNGTEFIYQIRIRRHLGPNDRC